jgi:lysophospholipase L1-like esterase
MKNGILFIAIILIHTIVQAQDTAVDWANFKRYDSANQVAVKGGVVFMGNSITQGWARQRPDFFAGNNYLGRGISGQTTSQMLVRFRRDVLDLQPTAVVILAGINDIARNTGFITVENTFGNIVSMVELAQAHKIKVILCSVLPAYAFKWRPGIAPAEDVIRLNKYLKEYAIANKHAYVDFHTAMKDERNGLPEKLAADGIHPNAEGYAIMEQVLKPVIDQQLKGMRTRGR